MAILALRQADSASGASAGGRRGRQPRFCPVEPRDDRGVLRREMSVERRLGDVRLGDHPVHADCIQDPLARRSGAFGRRSGGGSRGTG